MTTPTTETTEAPADTALTVDEAADAIFAKQTAQPSDEDARRNSDAGQEGDEDVEAEGATEEPPEGDDAADQPEIVEAGDDHVVRIGDQTVKIADLKRLAGQEAELAQAAAAVTQRRQEADQRFETGRLALDKLIGRAKEAFKPYEAIDWVVAGKELSTDELRALRAEAKAREDDVKFFEGEASQLRETAVKAHTEAMQAAATEAHKVLPEMIEKAGGRWNPEAWAEISAYATKSGFPAEAVAGWVDPNIIATVYKAMRYDAIRSKPAAKTKPTVVPAKPAAKGGARDAEGERPTNAKASAALDRLKQTGTVEDAAAAIFARMTARR